VYALALLVVALIALAVLACLPLSARLDRCATRVAMALFGRGARSRQTRDAEHANALEAAHYTQSYAAYASRTYLFDAALGGVAGLAAGALTPAALTEVRVLATPAGVAVPVLGAWLLLLVSVLVALLAGTLVGLLTHQVRWWMPGYRAGERGRSIDATIRRNVAFMFALSRSGMTLTKILRILADNRRVYGETAAEFDVAVRDVDLFGVDLVTALHRTARRTPSEDLQEFAENLTSVLQSGQNLSDFLRHEYEQYEEAAQSEQDRFVDLLATLAEAYVTLFVAGPLFLITILVVIGLVLGGTLTFLRVFAYVVVPLATVGFLVYLDSLSADTAIPGGSTAELGPGRAQFVGSGSRADGNADARTDGGSVAAANRYRLAAATRARPFRRALANPVGTLLRDPVRVLAVTVPVAVLYVGVRWTLALLGSHLTLASLGSLEGQQRLLSALDGPLVQATLLVLGSFAVVWEVRRRRDDAVERAIPDLLDRLASTNEAGMQVVDSLERVVDTDLGALDRELDRTWTDVLWGAHVERALSRLESRVRTPTVTRVVTLATNAMEATNDLGPVLRIAADEARANLRLKRDRRDELLTYVVVVYVAFCVFLGIIVALDVIFVPAIPTASQVGTAAGGAVGSIGQITASQKSAYTLLFFHTALVQAVCSGAVAGQMGDGDIRSGAKHAFALLLIAYAVFLVFG